MSTQIQKYGRPGFMQRITNAVKALTAYPQPQTGYSSTVPVYSSWGQWNDALNGHYAGSSLDYKNLVGDLSQSSLVMSGVRWLGNVLPSARLTVQETREGKDEEILDHSLPGLWYRPNKHYSGSRLMKGFAFSWILSGNVYILKVWNKAGTEVVELWWEPHYSIRPRWKGDNQGTWIARDSDSEDDFIAYYELDRGNRKVRVEVGDVIHFCDGFDSTTRQGLSRVGAILREVYGDNEAANYASNLAGGSGVPPFVLTLDKDLNVTQEDINGLENRLVRKTSGAEKGKPIVVTGGDVKTLGISPKDMDLRSSHRFSEERFAAITGIPALALELGAGHEQSTYNNVKQADERSYEAYLLPLYTHIEEELNVQLLEDYEGEGSSRFCAFDKSQVRALQEDETEKHERVWGDYSNGVITLAEARAALNYEVKPEHENVFSPKLQPKAPIMPDMEEKAIKSQKPKDTPSEDEISSMRESWISNAPANAADLFDAEEKGKANGGGEVLSE